LVQDVFLFFFQKPSTFNRSRGSGRTWVLYIAYNRAFDRRKYLNSRHFYTSQEFEEDLFQSPAGRGERPFHGSLLEEMLGRDIDTTLSQQLSSDQLETIRLHFAEGHTLKEIPCLLMAPIRCLPPEEDSLGISPDSWRPACCAGTGQHRRWSTHTPLPSLAPRRAVSSTAEPCRSLAPQWRRPGLKTKLLTVDCWQSMFLKSDRTCDQTLKLRTP
jgi:hypothetical protein